MKSKLVGTLFWPVYLLDVDKPVNDSGVTNKLSFKGVDDEDEPSTKSGTPWGTFVVVVDAGALTFVCYL